MISVFPTPLSGETYSQSSPPSTDKVQSTLLMMVNFCVPASSLNRSLVQLTTRYESCADIDVVNNDVCNIIRKKNSRFMMVVHSLSIIDEVARRVAQQTAHDGENAEDGADQDDDDGP